MNDTRISYPNPPMSPHSDLTSPDPHQLSTYVFTFNYNIDRTTIRQKRSTAQVIQFMISLFISTNVHSIL